MNCSNEQIAGYTEQVKIGMDVAASEFYTKEGKYDLDFKDKSNPQLISGEQLADLYKEWVKEYPIVSIEDPFDQDDFESYAKLNAGIFFNTAFDGFILISMSYWRTHTNCR